MESINLQDYPILFQDKNLGKDGHYSHVKTINAANVLIEMGWQPREVVTVKPRKTENKGFEKHRIRFFNENLPQIKGSFPEILLSNSYNAKSSFLIQLGIFRVVCANGMVVGESFTKEFVRHVGYSEQKVFESVSKLAKSTDSILSKIERFSALVLNVAEQANFAKQAIKFRLNTENDRAVDWRIDSGSINSVLNANRVADLDSSLYTIFNRVQENVCRKGFHVNKCDKLSGDIRPQKVRPLKSAFGADYINMKLWDLAEQTYAILA